MQKFLRRMLRPWSGQTQIGHLHHPLRCSGNVAKKKRRDNIKAREWEKVLTMLSYRHDLSIEPMSTQQQRTGLISILPWSKEKVVSVTLLLGDNSRLMEVEESALITIAHLCSCRQSQLLWPTAKEVAGASRE